MDELAHIVPMVLHEDAAPVTNILSGNMISISYLLGLGGEKFTQLLVATHVKRNKADGEDHSSLWKEILEDFEGLMKEDTLASGPWTFMLVFALGDGSPMRRMGLDELQCEGR
eukprot:1845557-Heterocapsa_arctica.AAC.1